MQVESLIQARSAEAAPRPRMMSAGLYGEIRAPVQGRNEPRPLESGASRGPDRR